MSIFWLNKDLLFKKKLFIFLRKSINLFSKKYSKIHLITDGASWAVDTSSNDILNYFNKSRFKVFCSLLQVIKLFIILINILC